MTRDEKWLLDEKYGGKETDEYRADLDRLAEGEPVAYVIGYQPFLGLRMYLDSKSLIPRPETEWWTEQLLNELTGEAISETLGAGAAGQLRRSKAAAPQFAPARGSAASGWASRRVLENRFAGKRRFLDLCAGSGAIGCAALARLPNARVYFGEIEPAHEATIKKNIRKNNLDESRADVRIGDLFEPFGDAKFDVIAANPPYVPASRVLPESVARYEPKTALLAGEDGLRTICRIAAGLPKHLVPGGVAWIECDRDNADAARTLFEERGFAAEIRTDQYGEPRIVVIHPVK